MAVRVVRAVLICAVVGYVVTLPLRPRAGYDVMFEGVLANLALFLCPVLCWWRARAGSTDRLPFALLGVGALLFACGNTVYVSHVQYLDPMPYPTFADVGYFGAYPFFVAAVLLFAHSALGARHITIWVDGIVGVLGVSAVGSALVLHTALRHLSGDPAVLVFGAAFPLADLLLLSMIVGFLTVRGQRLDRQWLALSAGLVVFALADITYLVRLSNGSYVQGTLLDALWVVGLAVLSLSSVQPVPLPVARRAQGAGSLVVTIVFSVAATGVLVAASATDMPWYAVAFAAATLMAGLVRAVVGVHQERQFIELRRQAGTDELTDLPNRRAFGTFLDQATAGGDSEGLAILLLDLDRFKEVNDLLGHHIGDKLLRAIGPRLSSLLRAGDTLCRLGGDEFGLVLPGASAATAMGTGRRLHDALLAPFVLDDITQQIGVSIGVAVWPEHAASVEELFQCADVAMYSAKRRGSGVELYDPEHGADGRKRLALARELTVAIESDQFVLHYQPKIDLGNGRVVGVEALVRWQHPRCGLLSPDVFLSVAEQMGSMPALTDLVLAAAISQLRQWRLDGHDFTVAVNLCASGLADERLVTKIAVLLTSASIPPDALVLEITESALISDPDRATHVLEEIRSLGVTLSVDDYGTGFSSLSYLRDLPVQELKIDRTFVSKLQPHGADAAIVRSTIDLAHSLGMRVVAEGVESAETLDLLARFGCDIAQGFYLCVPQTAGELTGWLRQQQPRTTALAPSQT